MLKNFVRREHHTEIEHYLNYDIDGNRGYCFPCDASGNVLPMEYEAARNNYEYCRTHPEEFEQIYVEHRKHKYTDPAHGTCSCGNEVYLWDQYMGACQCEKCGTWYNLFGQELIPPEYWEDDEEYVGGLDY